MREAKLRSTWASPNTAYEEAMLGFVRDALAVSRPNAERYRLNSLFPSNQLWRK